MKLFFEHFRFELTASQQFSLDSKGSLIYQIMSLMTVQKEYIIHLMRH